MAQKFNSGIAERFGITAALLLEHIVWSRKLITQIGNPGKNMGISRKGAIQQRLHMRNVRLLP